MRRHRPAILALVFAVLVVLPLTHGAAAAAQPSTDGDLRAGVDTVPGIPFVVEEQANTTNYLVMEDDQAERDDFGTIDLDVGTAVAADVERLEQGYGALAFENRYRNASIEERRELLRTETDRIEAQIDALQRRQESAISAYNRGDLTTRQFLTRLGTIDAAARELDKRRAVVEQTARESGSSRSFLVRLANVESELVPLRGPVRERIGSATGSAVPPQTLYVVTSADGVVLARTEGRVYQRDAFPASRIGSRRGPNPAPSTPPTGRRNCTPGCTARSSRVRASSGTRPSTTSVRRPVAGSGSTPISTALPETSSARPRPNAQTRSPPSRSPTGPTRSGSGPTTPTAPVRWRSS